MNMTLSKRGDYVMRSAILLARAFDDGSSRKIREVVAGTLVPQTFASQVLADLVRAGLATSRAGRGGGYRLSRAPSEITVLEVVEAAEGPLRADRCALGEGPCHWEAVCPLHETWSAATMALRDLLSSTSLAELASRDAAIEAGTYLAPGDSHRLHPASVGVSDVVQVELPATQAHLGLARAAADLDALATAALSGALPAAQQAGAPRPERSGGRLDVAASLSPTGPGPGKRGSRGTHYLLGWWVPRGEHAGHLEADLSVIAVDADRCALSVEGTWRPGPTAPAIAHRELELWAKRAVRAFLRNLAWELESPARYPPAGPARSRANPAGPHHSKALHGKPPGLRGQGPPTRARLAHRPPTP